MVLYCEHPLLGVKKNTKPFLHLSLAKAGPFTLESNVCLKALKCKVFQIIRCLIKPLLKNTEYGGSGPLRFAKPQSCKASLALHASKLQSLKAAKPLWRLTPQSLKAPKPLWRLTPQSLKASKLQSLFGASRFKASKPQSLNAWMLWRFGAWRLFQALALLGAFPTPQTPQSLNAWMLWRFGALALGGSCTLWRFLTLFRRLKASKPQSLNAWMLWRFGACPTPQSLEASKPERLDALALWRFGALALWRLALLMLWCLLALWRFAALWRFGALALWRLALLMLWCLLALWRFAALWRFGASWRFETSRLCDALALCGSLRHAILEKKWFCRFYFFSSTDWNIGIKAVSEKKQRARLFVFEGQRSPAASELTTTCLVIFVGCLMMVYLSRWLTSVVCKSPFRGS